MNISSREIHLWFAHDQEISDLDLLTSYHGLLNEEESQQQQRFHFEKHRHQYLITRALVRCTLSLYCNSVAPSQWIFKKNKYGKPAISNAIDLPLRFNLSHTDEMVVMAVVLEQEIGVDIEWLLREGQTIEIAEHFFSKKEVEDLHSLPISQQQERFFDLWTLKESYIKAYGMGLSIPLDQFSFCFEENKNSAILFDPQWKDKPENYLFWQIRPCNTHKVALALKTNKQVNGPYSLRFHKVVPMNSIEDFNPDFRSL